MIWVWTALGIAITLATLRDIAQTLFAPAGSGSISARLARGVWALFRRMSRSRPERLSLAGPAIVILTILLWTVGLTAGPALLYWPRLPNEFLLASGLNLAENSGFPDALYVSMVTLGTLGFGDITPQGTFLRLVMPLHALIGFALFTAAISWIMSSYPPIARQRHLARETLLLDANEAGAGRASEALNPVAYGDILKDFANQIVGIRNDLVHHPVTYYFRVSDQRSALCVALPSLHQRASQAAGHDNPNIRFQGMLLISALDDLASYLGQTWLPVTGDAETGAILRAYAEDQHHDLDRH